MGTISTSSSRRISPVETRTHLEAAKAAAAGKADIADIRRAVGGNHLVNNQGAVAKVGPSAQLHLPELLQSLHHIHCGKRRERSIPVCSHSTIIIASVWVSGSRSNSDHSAFGIAPSDLSFFFVFFVSRPLALLQRVASLLLRSPCLRRSGRLPFVWFHSESDRNT